MLFLSKATDFTLQACFGVVELVYYEALLFSLLSQLTLNHDSFQLFVNIGILVLVFYFKATHASA